MRPGLLDRGFQPGDPRSGDPRPAGQPFQPANTLRERIGPRFGRIDPNAIAKAEAALRGLSNQFGQWLHDEIGKLEAARATVHVSGPTPAAMDRLFTHGHDLKGLGATYGFPLITRIAGSLCKLLGDGEQRLNAPLFLIDSHIDTIRAAVRDDIRDVDNPVGRVLCEELESRVAAHLKD